MVAFPNVSPKGFLEQIRAKLKPIFHRRLWKMNVPKPFIGSKNANRHAMFSGGTK
ncbi:MAG: hypothetical protein KDJ90_21545 [Nitratireductor sp.]|nr:hypothetical protein [Nitratireductor sp.]